MSYRQRLLAVLDGRRPDVMPWFADLTYWCHGHKLAGDLPPEYEGDAGFVKLHVDYNVGYYLGYCSAVANTYDNVEIVNSTEGAVTTTLRRTPVGEIRGRTTFLPETASSAPTEWSVTTPDDLRVLRYIADATVSTPNFGLYDRLNGLAGDQGIPTVLAPRSPLSQMLWEWCGVTPFAYLEADFPADVELTTQALARAADPAYRAMEQWDTPFVEIPDNLTGDVMTTWFERYGMDYYVERLEGLHASGKQVGAHLDGAVRGLLPLLAKSGLDFVEAITPEPTGDVAVAELRDLAGPDIILFGGIPGAMFAPPFSADDMRRQVEQIIQHHWDYGKFIMGVADQVPPDGDIALVKLVGDLCEQLCE